MSMASIGVFVSVMYIRFETDQRCIRSLSILSLAARFEKPRIWVKKKREKASAAGFRNFM